MAYRGEMFSTRVTCEGRTYFFNVKQNRMGDVFLSIVESKPAENNYFERRSVIVFGTDMKPFLKAFRGALDFMEKTGNSVPPLVYDPARQEGEGGSRDRPEGGRSFRDSEDRGYDSRDRPYRDRQQGGFENREGSGGGYRSDRPVREDRGFHSDRPSGDRPYGDRPYGDRPSGDRPSVNRPYSDRPSGDRPYRDRPYGDRPSGDRPLEGRPSGDRRYAWRDGNPPPASRGGESASGESVRPERGPEGPQDEENTGFPAPDASQEPEHRKRYVLRRPRPDTGELPEGQDPALTQEDPTPPVDEGDISPD